MSLHTTYRPITFEEVLGQDKVVKSLQKVIEANRAHAFILTGPSGVGKTTLARITAKVLAGDATTLNIEELNAASNSGADDMRAVVSRTLFRAIGSSPVKAIILDEAHRLSSAAWTVLLKPIEEPPQHVYWFFCSTEPSKIPKPIQTRCLRYDLKPVDETTIGELLCRIVDTEDLDVSDEVIEIIAESSGGSPRQALVFLEACVHLSASEARQLVKSGGQSKEIIDLCRWLVGGHGLTWPEALKYIKPLEGKIEAESARIVISNYLASVLMNTKTDLRAKQLFSMLECFNKPYLTSDKFAPLLHSVAMAILDV